jgi:hypothetical protein
MRDTDKLRLLLERASYPEIESIDEEMRVRMHSVTTTTTRESHLRQFRVSCIRIVGE